MRNINFKNEFDIVLNWFNSFSYFSHKENLKILKNFYNAVKKDGILILETVIFSSEQLNLLTTFNNVTREFGINDKTYLKVSTTRFKRVKYGLHVNFSIIIYEKINSDKFKFIKEFNLNQILYYPEILIKMVKSRGFNILYVASIINIRKNYLNKIENLYRYASIIIIIAKK